MKLKREKRPLYIISVSILFSLLLTPLSGTFAARDHAKQPFTSDSPWNYPIGSGAEYKSVPGLNSKYLSINYGGNYTTGVYVGKSSDQIGKIYFRGGKMWTDLNNGYIVIDGKSYPLATSGNDPVVDDYLRRDSSITPQFDANYYSCVKPGCTTYSWPTDFHRTTDPYYSSTFNIPVGAKPSPDSDAHIAVFQPNGWVLEAYDAVVLANGDIACGLASYTNAFGEGTGWSSGRKASMLPNFGGLIRNGEITAGDIPHALVVLMSANLMKEEARWPAYAWDTRAGYGNCIDCMPMGALMAIPASVDISSLGLTTKGKVVARAAQDYGIYVADRGGDGITIQAELNATDYKWTGDSNDLKIIVSKLQWISNNSSTNRGGGGTPRRPLAAELAPIGGVTDTTAPVRSGGSPSGSLPAGTTQATISLATNENAVCKYSNSANTAYLSMTGNFSNTGNSTHSTAINNLTDGSSYNYYIRCQDKAAVPNYNTDDYLISFTVGAPAVQSPYPGPNPAVIPGKIEAENFDQGGESVSYHDNTVENSGNAYRTNESVDIQAATDTGGGYNVGWTEAGEWLEYTVNIQTTGNYDITARIAADTGFGGTFHIEIDGVNKTGPITVVSTGGWQNWTDIKSSNISLPAGQHVMRVVIDSVINGTYPYLANFNYFQITTPIALVTGDLNNDGLVNAVDFGIIKNDFLTIASQLINPKSDIDGDGIVTVKDIGIVMSNWK